jgi:hypothetical protein
MEQPWRRRCRSCSSMTLRQRRFALDGTEYEIDLNAGHAQELGDALASAGGGDHLEMPAIPRAGWTS